MASLSRESNGRRTIQFIGTDGKRRSIRLGKVSQRAAEAVKVRVEALVVAKASGCAVDAETHRWVTGIANDLRDRLVAVGLLDRRGTATLGKFLEGYIAGRAIQKPNSLRNYQVTQRHLLKHFGEDRPLAKITPSDADHWRAELLQAGLKQTTVGRETNRAKQFFKAAERQGLIVSSPFAHLKGGTQQNRSRFAFVTEETARKVLDACPDAEWRLIFALARYGGLRTPSETLALRWAGVDWAADRIVVYSPKTEHHAGRAYRQIPLFPELRPHLEAVWDLAEPGAEFVISRNRKWVNWRYQLMRIIERAGVQPWPKPFANLRSTRETELNERFPLHVVCAWIGNSEAIAAKHYLQTTDEHFAKAVQNPVQSTLNKAFQASARNDTALEKQGVFKGCEDLYISPEHHSGVGDGENSSGNTALSEIGGAISGAVVARASELPPDLVEVVEAWPALNESARAAVLEIIRSRLGGRSQS